MDGCDFVTVYLLACFFFHYFRSFVIIFRASGFLVTKYMYFEVISLLAQFLLQLLTVTRLLHCCAIPLTVVDCCEVITLLAQFLLQLLTVTRLLHCWRNSSYSC